MNNFKVVVRLSDGAQWFPHVLSAKMILCQYHLSTVSPRDLFSKVVTPESCFMCDKEWFAAYKSLIVTQQRWLNLISPEQTVYLAGPMTGIEDNNLPKFFMMEHVIKQTGCRVENPARHDQSLEYKILIRRGLKLLLDCDAIVMMKGWEHSVGANLEHQLAFMMHMVIHYEN